MCTFGLSGCRVKLPRMTLPFNENKFQHHTLADNAVFACQNGSVKRGRQGFTRQSESPNVHI